MSEPAAWYSKNMRDSRRHLGINLVVQFLRDLENVLFLSEGAQDGGNVVTIVCEHAQAYTSLYRLKFWVDKANCQFLTCTILSYKAF